MANFKTHITVSTLSGVGYGSAGHLLLGMPLSSSIIAGSLCSVAGMLPDLDSDSGVPVREMLSFAASAVPVLMVDRFRSLGLSSEDMVIAGIIIYFLVRFGLAEIVKRFTVHRGMFHSIPALVIACLVTFLLCLQSDTTIRIYKAVGVGIGFFSHLLLDEVWSMRMTLLGPRLKKSFGTAIKFFGQSPLANTAAYGIVLLLGFAVSQELDAPTPTIAEKMPDQRSVIDQLSSEIWGMWR